MDGRQRSSKPWHAETYANCQLFFNRALPRESVKQRSPTLALTNCRILARCVSRNLLHAHQQRLQEARLRLSKAQPPPPPTARPCGDRLRARQAPPAAPSPARRLAAATGSAKGGETRSRRSVGSIHFDRLVLRVRSQTSKKRFRIQRINSEIGQRECQTRFLEHREDLRSTAAVSPRMSAASAASSG